MKRAMVLQATGTAFLLLAAVTTASAFNVKPGLWEMTSTQHSTGAVPVPPDMLARLTPAQRAQVMAAMRARMNNSAPRVSHRCLTRDEVNDPLALNKVDQHCTPKVLSKTSSSANVKLVCSGTYIDSIILKWRAPTPKTVTGTYDVMAGQGGNMTKVHADFTGKWVGADCGNVR